VPAEPSAQARRGTRFHAWVEGWFGAASLVDVDALPGADDDSLAVDLDEQALRDSFLATPWAHRTPLAVEVDVETSVDGYVLRSRIDAVFPDEDAEPRVTGTGDAVIVVDWKTGAPPTDDASRASRELQLAVYRLAWSRWTGIPLERVRAAFCYVGTGETAHPQRLLDEAQITALLHAATSGDERAEQGRRTVPNVRREVGNVWRPDATAERDGRSGRGRAREGDRTGERDPAR